MWCENCNKETENIICVDCGSETTCVPENGVYWCHECKIPILKEPRPDGEAQTEIYCPICKSKADYLTSDLRPVFPQERLLLELLLGKKPNTYSEKSVWATDGRYFIDGKAVAVGTKYYQQANPDELAELLKKNEIINLESSFNKYIQIFIEANKTRLNFIKNEATTFVQKVAENFPEENLVVSFSGGKDSTAAADVVMKALGTPGITHIFGDTTLEFPMTYKYAERFIENNPDTPVWISKNYDQDFYSVCEDIGPPARMMRWCCSMFKTGPITRLLNEAFPDEQILTFYGIRKCESVSRSKYSRITQNTESVKIQKQTVASPIFFWSDLDVWLYILGEKVDFNEAYRWGYDRVGCWCCPNNTIRAQFLSKIYMPEESKKWRTFLIDFAEKIGKPDAEVYVDTGKWKARQGGNGLAAANDVKIKFTNCTAEEHAKIYSLVRPFDDAFIGMMTPFGIVAPELGRKLIQETIIVDSRTKVPIISIQPFSQEGYEYAVKIKTMNVAKHDDLQRMIGYQVRKFNACRKCLKCESICRHGAIMLVGDEYIIDSDKCVRCKMCVSAKYLDGGCLMDKYLRTK